MNIIPPGDPFIIFIVKYNLKLIILSNIKLYDYKGRLHLAMSFVNTS